MTAEEYALAALGLRPGAGRAEVDAAYRRLMKIYHPDRTGGDGRRAAEINRAYTFLRRNYRAHQPRVRRVPVELRPNRRSSRRGPWAVVLAGAVATGLVVYGGAPHASGGSSVVIPIEWKPADPDQLMRAEAPVSNFEEPLHSSVIGTAIADAMKFHSASDSEGAAEYSRDCHNRLRQHPNLALFDACAAFDESTLVLKASDPLHESGAFNGSAVTTREMAAARALSEDTFGADSRLNRIRSRVEIALLSNLEEFAGPKEP